MGSGNKTIYTYTSLTWALLRTCTHVLDTSGSTLNHWKLPCILKSVNGNSKQCRDLSPHDMNKLYSKLHVFLPSHFEAAQHFVLGSFLSIGFSYFL